MTSQITIIGLGQIGASIGWALEKYKGDILRVGHDKNMTAAKDAQKLGAVDKVIRNLPNSVQDYPSPNPAQEGDNPADISREAQQAIIISEMLDFLGQF